MKRVVFISMIFCVVIFAGCREDEKTEPANINPQVEPVEPVASVEPVQPAVPPTPFKAGMLYFDDISVVKTEIPEEDVFPIANGTSSVSAKSKSGVKMAAFEEPEQCHVEPYWFKLVAQMDALVVPLEG